METIVRFEYRLKKVFEAFEEAMDYRGLKFSTQSLQKYGFDADAKIQRAVNRALIICSSLEIDPKRHFRPYYKVDMANGQISKAWRVSKMGFYLVICNGEPGNPYVGSLQIQMLQELLPRL